MELADGRVFLHAGDCLEVLASLPENSIDAVVTDPPYHFTSIVKRFGSPDAAPAQFGSDGAFARASRGFMGKEWDGGDIAFRPDTWALIWRVLKPGGHMVAFGAPKNYHRLACAIEDSGFEIRDCLQWIFGTGFPKSHNLEGGLGTALKPAYEPIVLARKPLSEKTVAANVLRWGTGALNIDATRVDGQPRTTHADGNRVTSVAASGHLSGKKPHGPTPAPEGRWPANLCHDGSQQVLDLFPNDAGRFFYSSKASKADRAGSKHPTVKPVALMQWLIRMVTPPGGTVLDPFAGSGTTAQAAINEGFQTVLIEREEEYQSDIRNRLSA
jgi:site-specific DNA-methyltransferase (adenine-specific)